MPRMIPPYISAEVQSTAEKRIYGLIKESSDLRDFACLHSLGLAQHIRKRQGEIDFVLAGNGFIFCLEVKGGRVERKDGLWCFTDRYGRINKKTESPFAQASSAMHSLRARVESKFQRNTGFIFGYGVLMPDVRFAVESPEWDAEIVYDLDDAGRPFGEYVKRLENYWRAKSAAYVQKISLDELVEYLRGDFDIVILLWKQLADGEEVLLKFTAEQYRALDRMEGNKRIIFTGSAGTGKTLLAVEKCRRAAFEGKNVLLLCFNRLLGLKLAEEVRSTMPTGQGFIAADSVHRYFSKVIRKAGLQNKLQQQSAGGDFYGANFIGVFTKACQALNEPKFDVLVVDEGQDILNKEFLSALDQIISGGFDNGEWTVFLDPGIQSRLFNRFSLEAYSHLRSLGVPEYKLDINCRNTVQIATQTLIVSGFPTGIAGMDGPEVEYVFYPKNKDESLLVVGLLRHLVEKEKIRPADITVLSARSVGKMSLLATGARLPEYLAELTDKTIVSNDKATYASVQSFKGLENKIIIYTDLEDIEDKWCESVNYVGMTRARQKLYVFLRENLRNEYNQRALNFAKNKNE